MQKIKLFIESEKGKNILTALIVVLVGLGSFELGRLSKSDKSGGIRIEYPNEASAQEANAISAFNRAKSAQETPELESSSPGKNFFASRRGKKYYPLGCPAGNNLKEANKIWFESREEAERAGYELSSSCR